VRDGAIHYAVIVAERQRSTMERMAIESLMTTGRFSMAPRPRMPTLGWPDHRQAE